MIPRVLLVDDDDRMRNSTAQALELAGALRRDVIIRRVTRHQRLQATTPVDRR